MANAFQLHRSFTYFVCDRMSLQTRAAISNVRDFDDFHCSDLNYCRHVLYLATKCSYSTQNDTFHSYSFTRLDLLVLKKTVFSSLKFLDFHSNARESLASTYSKYICLPLLLPDFSNCIIFGSTHEQHDVVFYIVVKKNLRFCCYLYLNWLKFNLKRNKFVKYIACMIPMRGFMLTMCAVIFCHPTLLVSIFEWFECKKFNALSFASCLMNL